MFRRNCAHIGAFEERMLTSSSLLDRQHTPLLIIIKLRYEGDVKRR